ncbi:putative ankyrin repeat protein RBE_0220 isoform X1 [Mytilus californianus]|uniref:putative ankyrin repeat protein RBE_0220 isoform X1 n=1 Tax=Mytilus californianus TaxID=6549 RepID=UPI002247058A|nr:putative ankyrin repeat protein RBE_0220 isoform X1 [Mytilus californianus]XP_052065369.1 putative ankyrin repeat protein RBE_0220 isoform X1 [Mytilus californianus]
MVACRLQVYQDNNFDTLSIFNSSVCNFLSVDMCLTKKEKQSIAEVYLETKAIEISDYYDLYDCFPLLCQLYYENPTNDIKHFFQHPYSVYEAQVDQLQKRRCFGKYCALVLCVMFNNKLNEDMLTKEIDEETKTIIENTCETCKLDRGTSRLFLKDEMDSLLNTLLKKQDKLYPTTENNKLILKTKSFYTTIHDKIFHFLAKYFGQKIIGCLIKNADSCLIREIFLLERIDATDQSITSVPSEYHQLYMQRMIDDWSKGKLQDVFNNKNMKMRHFRQRFLCYLNTLDVGYQKQLVHACDTDYKRCIREMLYYRDIVCDTVMLHCCSIGDMNMIQWCCSHGVDVNESGICGQSPLMIVCRYGHTDIVRMFLNKAADCNKCDEIGQSPTLMACIHGHTTIVRMLIDNGADYSKCDNLEQSPLFMACKHNHTDIVEMLINREADYKKCDLRGQSPVIMTCLHGHLEILKMMLEREADDSKCDNTADLLVMMACKLGHTSIVKMLLDKGANQNTSDILGHFPLFIACKHGHTKIVRMLLDIGANYKKCDNDGMSPVMIACMHGHTQIVAVGQWSKL